MKTTSKTENICQGYADEMHTSFFVICALLRGYGVQRLGCVLIVMVLLVGLTAPRSRGAVGDVVGQPIRPQAPTSENLFSVGLAFVGGNSDANRNGLYVNRNGDSKIYLISPVDGSPVNPSMPFFDTGIMQWPSAMAYDPNRHGLWIGTQKSIGGPGFGACGDSAMVDTDMPIYFWDFDDDSVTLMFTIPFNITNPANGQRFFTFCRLDGLGQKLMDALENHVRQNIPGTCGWHRRRIVGTLHLAYSLARVGRFVLHYYNTSGYAAFSSCHDPLLSVISPIWG